MNVPYRLVVLVVEGAQNAVRFKRASTMTYLRYGRMPFIMGFCFVYGEGKTIIYI